MSTRFLLRAVLTALVLGCAPTAHASSSGPDFVPGEVIVHYRDGTSSQAQARIARTAAATPPVGAAATGGALAPAVSQRLAVDAARTGHLGHAHGIAF